MKTIIRFHTAPDDTSITLICVIWNELLLLPFFIDYYKKLGVTHFVFIDNNSSDGTVEYLMTIDNLNVEVYSNNSSYADAKFGIDWVNSILNNLLLDKWCLVVDIDEILLLKDGMSLPQLVSSMEDTNANIAQTVLVDFYPPSFNQNILKEGEPFSAQSNCFHKFTEDTIRATIAPDGSLDVKGGVRHIITNGSKRPNSSSVCLSKKSFFKYDFYKTHHLSVGMHWILPNDFTCWWPPESAYKGWSETNQFLKFFKDVFAIAHFKYVKPNIIDVFQVRIDRNQDWNNSSEYKNYVNSATSSFWDSELSLVYENNLQLYNATINTIS